MILGNQVKMQSPSEPFLHPPRARTHHQRADGSLEKDILNTIKKQNSFSSISFLPEPVVVTQPEIEIGVFVRKKRHQEVPTQEPLEPVLGPQAPETTTDPKKHFRFVIRRGGRDKDPENLADPREFEIHSMLDMWNKNYEVAPSHWWRFPGSYSRSQPHRHWYRTNRTNARTSSWTNTTTRRKRRTTKRGGKEIRNGGDELGPLIIVWRRLERGENANIKSKRKSPNRHENDQSGFDWRRSRNVLASSFIEPMEEKSGSEN